MSDAVETETEFELSFVGMDGLEQSQSFGDLGIAQKEAVALSEHGCQEIHIIDCDGIEYAW